MLFRALGLFIVFTLISCSSENATASFDKSVPAMQNESSANRDQIGAQNASATMNEGDGYTTEVDMEEEAEVTPLVLLRQGHCRVEVEHMDHEINRIQFLMNDYEGYVSDLNIQNNRWSKEATFLLRVPAKYFQNTLDSIKAYSKKVDYQRISTQDVTEEFVDISSRLETKKQVRDRYVDILRNKAKTVEEILLAEEKIRHLQEEIEAKEGRLRYLKDRASMSTITVELFQKLEPTDEEEEEESWLSEFLDDAGDSLGMGGRIIRGLVLGLMAIWPVLLIVGLIVWRRKTIRAKLFGKKD